MLAFRSILFNLIFYVVLVVMMIVGLPLIFGSAQGIRNWARRWARISVWLLKTLCDVSVEVRGAHNLPTTGCVLACKHQSFLDIMLLLPLVPRFVFVLKRELTWIPLFGLYLLRAGMIPIDRSKGRAVLSRLTAQVAAVVQQGEQLIIFPEGTRRSPGAPPAYKSGVSHLYAGTGAPCVPIALNTGTVWPRRSFRRLPGRVVIEVLPPIPPGLPKEALLATLEARIEAASDQLLAAA